LSRRRRHTSFSRDWSSDVCSSDLELEDPFHVLPRQDMEWILEFGKVTPESSMELLATMQPTSQFGEMFQYSNVLASAAGYVAAQIGRASCREIAYRHVGFV